MIVKVCDTIMGAGKTESAITLMNQDMGLITGNGTVINGEPNYMWQDLVTREQFVTVLYRLAQIMGSPA